MTEHSILATRHYALLMMTAEGYLLRENRSFPGQRQHEFTWMLGDSVQSGVGPLVRAIKWLEEAGLIEPSRPWENHASPFQAYADMVRYRPTARGWDELEKAPDQRGHRFTGAGM